MCSFWDGGRSALWEEKLKLRPRFAGNAATMWGTSSEDLALQRCVLRATAMSHALKQLPAPGVSSATDFSGWDV